MLKIIHTKIKTIKQLTMHQNIKFVLFSTSESDTLCIDSALYTVIEQSFGELHESNQSSMATLIDGMNWADTSPGGNARPNNLSGVAVFKTLTTLFSQ